MSSTPTLFLMPALFTPQLSSCYLSTVSDDLYQVFLKAYADDAQLSKRAGGLGRDWSRVRATGAYIQGTNGKSQGVVPFLKVYKRYAGCSKIKVVKRKGGRLLLLRKHGILISKNS